MNDYEKTSQDAGQPEAGKEDRKGPRTNRTRRAGTKLIARGGRRKHENRSRSAHASRLQRYRVVVQTQAAVVSYIATGNRDKLMDDVYDQYGACGIAMRPL